MLPDFRGAGNIEEISSRFYSSATRIMSEYQLYFGANDQVRKLRITSLELYLYCKAWSDPNADRSKEQKGCGTWYVHRNGTLANNSRVDITAGDEAEDIHCGLLVRGVDGRDGSGRAIKKIIRGYEPSPQSWSPPEIDILDQINGAEITRSPLKLQPAEKIARSYSRAARVNLWSPNYPWDAPLRLIADVS
jgi:hypothetical protein